MPREEQERAESDRKERREERMPNSETGEEEASVGPGEAIFDINERLKTLEDGRAGVDQQ